MTCLKGWLNSVVASQGEVALKDTGSDFNFI